MAILSKGIQLAQHKEPAFSRPMMRFVNPHTDSAQLAQLPLAEPDDVGADKIIEVAKNAKITDERDGRWLYRKLMRAKENAKVVVVDAVDDEPYVSSKISALLWCTEEVLGGLRLCRKVAAGCTPHILVYQMNGSHDLKIPKTIGDVPVTFVRSGYPAPPASSHIKSEPGTKMVVGVGALIHLYRAVYQNKRQNSVFVTVAGNCITTPMNLEVSLGMTVMQVLDYCGLLEEPTRMVCGGTMTGTSVAEPDKTVVTYNTRAILAFRESKQDTLYSCIGCGRCEQVCPAGLNPMYIHRFVENSYYANLRPFDAHLCIGCGTCSYVCPSKLGVSASAVKAKQYALDHFIESSGEADDYGA